MRKETKETAQKEEMIGLAFSKDQFLVLLKMVYIANTIANGRRNDEEFLKPYDDIEQYMFSRARLGGLAAATWRHDIAGVEHNHPSQLFERDQELAKILDKYDEATFWDELEMRLAERDVEERYGKEAKVTLNPEKFRELIGLRTDIYEQLFNDFGLKHLKIGDLPPLETN